VESYWDMYTVTLFYCPYFTSTYIYVTETVVKRIEISSEKS